MPNAFNSALILQIEFTWCSFAINLFRLGLFFFLIFEGRLSFVLISPHFITCTFCLFCNQ